MNESKNKKIDSRSAWELVIADSSRLFRFISGIAFLGGALAYIYSVPTDIADSKINFTKFKNQTELNFQTLNDWRYEHMQHTAVQESRIIEIEKRINVCCPYYKP